MPSTWVLDSAEQSAAATVVAHWFCKRIAQQLGEHYTEKDFEGLWASRGADCQKSAADLLQELRDSGFGVSRLGG